MNRLIYAWIAAVGFWRRAVWKVLPFFRFWAASFSLSSHLRNRRRFDSSLAQNSRRNHRSAKLFGISILVAASNASAQQLDSGTLDKLLLGTLKLESSFFNTAYTGRDETLRLYNEKRWHELVQNVLGKRWEADIYYFFLGRAAEELGARKAAQVYFDLALNKPGAKCDAYLFGNACMGFKFPEAVLQRPAPVAAQPKGRFMSWTVGDGPTITELASLKEAQFEDLVTAEQSATASRGKFETEEEFLARTSAGKAGFLVVSRAPTDDDKRCTTDYQHDAQKYRIQNCRVYSPGVPILVRKHAGQSFTLANLMDSREIKREITSSYFVDYEFTLNHEIKLSRDDAKALDSELMVGIVFSGFSRTSKCPECEDRKSRETRASAMESLGVLTNRRVDTSDVDWKKDAFRRGAIEESWTHSFALTGVKKVFLFRRSDKKVLLEFTPEQ